MCRLTLIEAVVLNSHSPVHSPSVSALTALPLPSEMNTLCVPVSDIASHKEGAGGRGCSGMGVAKGGHVSKVFISGNMLALFLRKSVALSSP